MPSVKRSTNLEEVIEESALPVSIPARRNHRSGKVGAVATSSSNQRTPSLLDRNDEYSSVPVYKKPKVAQPRELELAQLQQYPIGEFARVSDSPTVIADFRK